MAARSGKDSVNSKQNSIHDYRVWKTEEVHRQHETSARPVNSILSMWVPFWDEAQQGVRNTIPRNEVRMRRGLSAPCTKDTATTAWPD